MLRTATVALTVALIAAPVTAQEISGLFVGEIAGDDVSLVLLGVSAHPTGTGLQPVASLQGYRVGYPAGNGETNSVYAVTPAVGLRYRMNDGFLEGKVGYSIRSDDGDFPFFGGSESGFTNSLHAEYWNNGAFGLQGLGSYNWGSDFLWSRARGTVRLLDQTSGGLHVGAEAVWQGEMEEDPTLTPPAEEYQATLFGPILQWISRSGWMATVGAGWKDDNTLSDDTWYLRTELQTPFR